MKVKARASPPSRLRVASESSPSRRLGVRSGVDGLALDGAPADCVCVFSCVRACVRALCVCVCARARARARMCRESKEGAGSARDSEE